YPIMQEFPGKSDFPVQMKLVSFWIFSGGVKLFLRPRLKADSDLWIPWRTGCRFNKARFLRPKSVHGIFCERNELFLPLLRSPRKEFFFLLNLRQSKVLLNRYFHAPNN